MRSGSRFLLAGACVATFACGAVRLDVGTTVAVDDAGAPLPDGGAPPRTTTDDGATLSACALPAGTRDGYASAADLVLRMTGRWELCPTKAPPFADPVDGIELGRAGSTGTYTVLERQGTILVKRTDTRGHGTFKIWAYSDPDAGIPTEAGVLGEGGAPLPQPGFVSLDDTKGRGSLLLYLYASDGNADVIVSVDFERNPRRMFAREVGGVDVAAGDFVPAP